MKNSKWSNISETQLKEMYYDQNMSLTEIAKHFRYFDRQPIHKLFKKYSIKTRSHKESGALRITRSKQKIPDKETLLKALGDSSINTAASKMGVSRKKLTGWLKHHEIRTDTFFVNKGVSDLLKDKSLTFKEASIKYNTDVSTIKRYRQNQTSREYNQQQIKEKIVEYGYNLTAKSRGISEQIKLDDPDLYSSIINCTKNHTLSTDKFVERLYRITNGYHANQIDGCKFCKKPLRFYTFEIGYGNSEIGVCRGCFPKHSSFGVSVASQKFFWEVYEKLNGVTPDECFFHELNKEKNIKVHKDKCTGLNTKVMNKKEYRVDFLLNNKIVEFDGIYWHQKTKIKDKEKDKYLSLLGYEVLRINEPEVKQDREKAIKKCLDFLNQ